MKNILLIGAILIMATAPVAVLAAPGISTGSLGNTTGGGAGSGAGSMIGCGAAASVGGAVDAANLLASAGAGARVPTAPSDAPANALTSQNVQTQTTVECVLNGLVYQLKQGLIAALVQSIIDWINSGFQGGPSFVTNLGDFLQQIADNTSLDFLKSANSPLAAVCSPFKLQIQITLANESRNQQKSIQCSLGDATRNIEGFLGGDFSQGGWPAWFSLSTNIQNNPYGAYLASKSELSAEIIGAQNLALTKYTAQGSFLDKEVCDAYDHTGALDANGQAKCVHSHVVTPGETIAHQLNQSLDAGLDELKLADQINEIVNALLAQLGKMALTSIEGVTGLSSSHSSSASAASSITGGVTGSTTGGSYLDQLVSSTNNGSLAAGTNALSGDIAAVIATQTTYTQVLTQIISTVTTGEGQYGKVYDCVLGVAAATSTQSAQQSPQIKRYSDLLTRANQVLTHLKAIAQAITAAQTVDQLNAASNEYDTLVQSGAVATAGDLLVGQNDAAARTQAITDIAAGTNPVVSACQATP